MELRFKNAIHTIETALKENLYYSNIDNQDQQFSIRKINDNIFSVETGNGSLTVFAASDKNHIYVNFDGENFVFELVDESAGNFEFGGSNDKTDVIKPPMPGSVVKVLVEKDQKVSEGDGLIIIEAMKMETTMYSSISGLVKEINVKAGEQVDTDKVLIVVEKEEE